MKRRTFLKMAAASGVGMSRSPSLRALQTMGTVPVEIHTVLLITKCHLDVGFTQSQRQVMDKYFNVYFPRAIEIATKMRETSKDRYVWTTGSWLVYEYLEQASASERRLMEAAVEAGDICWHALPFSWQTEMLSPSLMAGALGLSNVLDRRFGHQTIGAKMTDVPGHSRGIIAPLSAGGIRLLDIGVNAASTPPEVPDLFLWKDSSGKSLITMYHRHDYGGVVLIPSAGVAVSVEVRGDNSGPHTPEEIAAIYTRLRSQFPKAEVRASTLNEVAAAVVAVQDRLPVVTAEIGDTWIYGCSSDPTKVARYRELARLREGWIQEGRFTLADPTDRNLLRRLLLAAEHTWGTDTKTYLDNDHYRPQDLDRVLSAPGYVVMQRSWAEKRADIDDGVASLPAALQAEAKARMDLLEPRTPSLQGLAQHNPEKVIATRHFDLAFDAGTGAINKLRDRRTGRDWATSGSPLALFTYQTLSAGDYEAYLQRYLTLQTDWAPRDFGKPEMARTGALAREWHPKLKHCWSGVSDSGTHVCLQLAIDDPEAAATGNVAWPAQIYLEVFLPSDEPAADLRLTCLGKVANRLPEAMWLTFAPSGIEANGWTFEKAGAAVAALDVVRGGGRRMHAVQEHVYCRDAQHRSLTLRTLDAPVIAAGNRTPLNFSLDLPAFSDGVHFSLFNNAWGTNYPQWAGGDWLFRFRLTT